MTRFHQLRTSGIVEDSALSSLRPVLWLLGMGAIAGVIGVAAEPQSLQPYAWYRADRGLERVGPHINTWTDSATAATTRSLGRIVGHPQAVRVKTPTGEKTIVRLDGASALWQTAGGWGQLKSAFSVVIYLRTSASDNGYLFDGSTRVSAAKVRFQSGQWLMPDAGGAVSGSNLRARTDGEAALWQMHAFVFESREDTGRTLHYQGGSENPAVLTGASGPLIGFMVGADFEGKNPLQIDLAEIIVFDRALSRAEIRQQNQMLEGRWGQPEELPGVLPGAELPNDPRIYRRVLRRQGEEGVHTSRIPGLATTSRGTLIAVFDLRHSGQGDLPANIDVGMMRSTDQGTSWSRARAILDFDEKAAGSRGNGVGDPCILIDRERGGILVAALWSHGDRAWKGSGPGLSPKESGQLVLTRSDDDGLTWTAPINITAQVKNPRWRLCFNGPGNGIQLRDGTLVMPAQYRDMDAEGIPHSCFIWSTDHGTTWRISAPAVATAFPSSESQIAQLADGSLLLTMRNERRIGERGWARYDWNGDVGRGRWSDPWLTVPDPTCQASLIQHSSGRLLFSNPNSSTQRVAMTLRTSEDGGHTWSEGRLLDPRPSSYSCLTELSDGRIGILYECGDNYAAETLVFARFPLQWVTDRTR